MIMDILPVKFKLALLLSLSLITKHAHSVDFVEYKDRKDYKIKTQYIVDELSATSHVQCLLFCSMHDGCFSVSYKISNKCLLSTRETTGIRGDSPGIPHELESIEGWTTFSRSKYPGMD